MDETSSTISLTTKVKVEDEWYSAIVDTGAAVSTISQTLMKKIGFTIQAPVTYKIKGVGGQRIILLGVIHDFHVKIGKITIPIEVAVLDIPSCQLILGNDFLKKVNAQILYADPSPTLTITWLGRQQTITTECQSTPQLYTDVEEGIEEEDEEDELPVLTYKAEPDWIDLGERRPNEPFDISVQMTAGHYCKYCHERAFDHHMHYLVKERRPNDPVVREDSIAPTDWPDIEEEGWPELNPETVYEEWGDNVLPESTSYWGPNDLY
jgi:predicted aspartyl protease